MRNSVTFPQVSHSQCVDPLLIRYYYQQQQSSHPNHYYHPPASTSRGLSNGRYLPSTTTTTNRPPLPTRYSQSALQGRMSLPSQRYSINEMMMMSPGLPGRALGAAGAPGLQPGISSTLHNYHNSTSNNNNNNNTVPLERHRFRKPARAISIIDAIFATSLLVFHGLTLMVQEFPTESSPEDNWLLPRVPMTPEELTITGYMEVIAWIGILGINFTQLLIAVGLFNGCDKNTEALKAFESTRVYIKTSMFVLTILVTKLCILYFMHQMEMTAIGTLVFTSIETLFHIGGMFLVFKFFQEIKTNYPTITEIYLTPAEDDGPKVNPVSDAVWF